MALAIQKLVKLLVLRRNQLIIIPLTIILVVLLRASNPIQPSEVTMIQAPSLVASPTLTETFAPSPTEIPNSKQTVVSTMTPTDIFTIFLSSAALVFSWISFSNTKEHEKQRIVDDTLSRILELNLQYPDFDKRDFTENYENSNDKMLSKQYEIYATIVWNFLERLYIYYGAKKLKRMEFWGAFKYWSDLHYHWFSCPEFYTSYSKDFKNFVDELILQKSKNIS